MDRENSSAIDIKMTDLVHQLKARGFNVSTQQYGGGLGIDIEKYAHKTSILRSEIENTSNEIVINEIVKYYEKWFEGLMDEDN